MPGVSAGANSDAFEALYFSRNVLYIDADSCQCLWTLGALECRLEAMETFKSLVGETPVYETRPNKVIIMSPFIKDEA